MGAGRRAAPAPGGPLAGRVTAAGQHPRGARRPERSRPGGARSLRLPPHLVAVQGADDAGMAVNVLDIALPQVSCAARRAAPGRQGQLGARGIRLRRRQRCAAARGAVPCAGAAGSERSAAAARDRQQRGTGQHPPAHLPCGSSARRWHTPAPPCAPAAPCGRASPVGGAVGAGIGVQSAVHQLGDWHTAGEAAHRWAGAGGGRARLPTRRLRASEDATPTACWVGAARAPPQQTARGSPLPGRICPRSCTAPHPARTLTTLPPSGRSAWRATLTRRAPPALILRLLWLSPSWSVALFWGRHPALPGCDWGGAGAPGPSCEQQPQHSCRAQLLRASPRMQLTCRRSGQSTIALSASADTQGSRLPGPPSLLAPRASLLPATRPIKLRAGN